MEQIYTIPVNEAFDKSAKDEKCGCPFCSIYEKLQSNEIETIMGASMMEPATRMETNKKGFCRKHYEMMEAGGSKLSLALVLESHIEELKNKLKGNFLSSITGADSKIALATAEKISESCYVCDNIDMYFSKMTETAVFLFSASGDFREKFKAQPYFCLPHYARILKCAKDKLDKKKFSEFYKAISELENKYFEKIKEDVSWFCKKFDYRYDKEPWYDSKDAIERAVKFLSGTK